MAVTRNYLEPPPFSNPFLEALIGPSVFAPTARIYWILEGRGTNNALGGTEWRANGAADAFVNALRAWMDVMNLDIRPYPFNWTEGDDRSRALTTWLERLSWTDDSPELGFHDGPGAAPFQEGGYNNQHPVFTRENNAIGGYSFITFLHEIGHALGLEHPHDGDLFPGVTSAGDAGNFSLNQGIFTVMSYRDGSDDKGYSPSFAYGWQATPGAFDIAAVQALYGANMSTRTGDDVYVLPGVNEAGTYYATIWDAGGIDTISAEALSLGTTIDLRAATLLEEPGGGGWLSSANGIYGGFTIANTVVIENAVGGSGDDLIIGNSASNVLTGGLGDDILEGGANIDMAVFGSRMGLYTITQTSTGVFEIAGPDGTDTLTGVEYLEFSNTTIRLLPGTGVSVNFNTADPSVYQAAMENIRDFDGNSLGGDGAWLRIGSADVDGDGDIDQILVNDAIGRFATVGGSRDGLAYFDDYSWAGETRVVGIYIDPLVESGDVVAGSDQDSQQRFQNDLLIENINRVLGADDYDGDGLQEVYLALTDGTAYLHMYMHADGNIRYANYQSQQEVIDFLTANGYDESTWADWFPSTQEGPDAKVAAGTEEPVLSAASSFGALTPIGTEEVASLMAELGQFRHYNPVEAFA